MDGVSARSGSPRASVVMTVYNDLRFLDEAVDSILRQEATCRACWPVDRGAASAAALARLGEEILKLMKIRPMPLAN